MWTHTSKIILLHYPADYAEAATVIHHPTLFSLFASYQTDAVVPFPLVEQRETPIQVLEQYSPLSTDSCLLVPYST
jgi:hypothetical protein